MSSVSYTCSVGGKKIHGAVDSSSGPQSVLDASDISAVYDAARTQLHAGPTSDVTCSRMVRERKTHPEDLEWIQRRMTPSCKRYGWDPSQVVSYDKWRCKYAGEGTVVDKHGNKTRVRNPFKQWSGTIASCAALDEDVGLSIPDSTYSAVQRWAYHQADGDNAELDPKQFVCTIESIPRV